MDYLKFNLSSFRRPADCPFVFFLHYSVKKSDKYNSEPKRHTFIMQSAVLFFPPQYHELPKSPFFLPLNALITLHFVVWFTCTHMNWRWFCSPLCYNFFFHTFPFFVLIIHYPLLLNVLFILHFVAWSTCMTYKERRIILFSTASVTFL